MTRKIGEKRRRDWLRRKLKMKRMWHTGAESKGERYKVENEWRAMWFQFYRVSCGVVSLLKLVELFIGQKKTISFIVKNAQNAGDMLIT